MLALVGHSVILRDYTVKAFIGSPLKLYRLGPRYHLRFDNCALACVPSRNLPILLIGWRDG